MRPRPRSARGAYHEKRMLPETSDLLGHIDWDRPGATNERVVLRAPRENRARLLRNKFVRITDAKAAGIQFLGRIVPGPFFADQPQREAEKEEARDGDITAEIEIQ